MSEKLQKSAPMVSCPSCASQQLKNNVYVGYVEDLFGKLWEVMQGENRVKVTAVVSPPPLCDSLERPNKEEAIAQHKSRFSK